MYKLRESRFYFKCLIRILLVLKGEESQNNGTKLSEINGSEMLKNVS